MIFVDEDTRVIVQGITGRQGRFHTKLMLEYGTNIVAGVTPGKKGEIVHGVKVFNTIEEALEKEDAEASIIFVPAPFAKDAAFEAIEHLDLVVIITEHIPVHDSMEIKEFARKHGTRVIGPNTPGIIAPEYTKIGIMPSVVFKKGSIGVTSRSGTLSYEIALALSKADLGQSTLVGIGGDAVIGTSFREVLEAFENDDDTDAVVLIGEIGGNEEEIASEFIKKMKKPVVAYIAGLNAPKEKRMGHAGAIVYGKSGTAESKIEALKSAGAYIAKLPQDIPALIKEVL